MANVGTAAAGKTLIGAGNGASPTYASIGTNSGLPANTVVLAEGNGAFTTTNVGNSGQVLTSNGFGVDPSFQSGGTHFGNTITGNDSVVLSPTAGNWNIFGASTAAGTSPVRSTGSGSTLTLNVQKSQAIAATDATKVGLANFDSASFAVDANGFVTFTGKQVWSDVSGAVAAASNHGYFVTGTCTSTLPAAPAQGDVIEYIVDTTQILTIQANTGQFIRLANTISASAGTAANKLQGDSISLRYRTSDTTWLSLNGNGQWDIT